MTNDKRSITRLTIFVQREPFILNTRTKVVVPKVSRLYCFSNTCVDLSAAVVVFHFEEPQKNGARNGGVLAPKQKHYT
jgi:hypothetical protein